MEEAIHGISGGVSGLVAVLVWYPLDTLRFRQQADILNIKKEEIVETIKKIEDEVDKIISPEDKKNEEVCSYNSMWKKIKDFFASKLDSLKYAQRLIKNEGVGALYNGIGSASVGTVITYFIYFYSYKYFKNMLVNHNWSKGIIIDAMVTSFLAACATSIGSNPIWVLNSRMAKSSKERGNISNWGMVKQIYNEEGIGAFFKGVIPALFLTANPVIQFVIYEFLRERLLDSSGNISGINVILISIISKYLTTLATYPMLTAKTLFQANENKTNKEIIDILIKLLKDEGIHGYYKGLSAKIVQTVINNVILMLTYEKIQFLVKIVVSGLILKLVNNKK